MRILAILFSLLMIASGCRITYRYHGKRKHIVHKEYKPTTLHVSKHVLCVGLYRESLATRDIPNLLVYDKEAKFHDRFNTDSIFNIYLASMKSLNLHLEIHRNNKNYCDESYFNVTRTRFKHYDVPKLLELIGDTENKTILFPAIFLDNRYRDTGSGDFGLNSETGIYARQCILRMAIIIVENNNIKYLRVASHFGSSYYTINKDNMSIELEQENWDKLVALVMRDYIKGLNRYKSKNLN